MQKDRIDIISLGCSKNLIDSERLIRRLEAKGYDAVHNSSDVRGEYVMVNTCGFIGDAKEESINMLLRLTVLKEAGIIGRIAVMGCLSQRYMDELRESIPEIDFFYGKFDWDAFISELPDRRKSAGKPRDWERHITTPPHSAYLKISEGCNRFCAFCAIPLITGRHHSRPIDEIEEEVRSLVDGGVREFNIIAQDLSSYGLDIYGRHALAELVDRLADITGVEWLRLHYAYPADFPYDVLEVMRRRDNVCKYLDIALQHISDSQLTRMRRHFSKQQTLDLIERIRREVPGIALRTTLMVGFPGEKEEDFAELMDFVRETKFERLGAFAYSEEEGTFAAENYTDDVLEEVKTHRRERVMAAQRHIAEAHNEALVGRTLRVLVDGPDEEGILIGRTEWDSPEVDNEVIIRTKREIPAGSFVDVRITGCDPYTLEGIPEDEAADE